MTQKVRELMTGPATTVAPDTDLGTVARMMRDEAIGSVMVTGPDGSVGMVTDRDMVVRGLSRQGHPETLPVREVCSTDPVSVRPDDDATVAIKMMSDRKVRRLPVIQDGQVVGVISLGDLAAERDSASVLGTISGAMPS
ncbi:CBS domain-containing protein [Actinomadura rupiterrae]|uniref:CBS domain-containing protein n=1 Tax=Actinomadura rupiterrae TaxID=559627 RepID=UPI0020A4F8B8|nr:CBS domain-containing protein [Actinomadura rupiterrae]MCP2342768.1 signal-transduction protein with cAMP-binding, CBS, and nucleotidyltransferase domain [Actinomadura rupiterrae]